MLESYQEIRIREKAEENKQFTKGLIILTIAGILFFLTFLAFHPAIEKGRMENQGFTNTSEKK